MSSYQLAKDIKVTQKTAYYMLQRMREAVRDENFTAPMNGIVEVDDTYIGDKEKTNI